MGSCWRYVLALIPTFPSSSNFAVCHVIGTHLHLGFALNISDITQSFSQE